MIPQPWGLLNGAASPLTQPAGYALYPTAADLSAFLEDAGIVPSDFRLDASVLSGINEVEAKCQRHFLAGRHIDNTPQPAYARHFDPPTDPSFGTWGAMLELGPYGELARIDSVIYMPQGSQPQTWTAPQDYRPMPQNALVQGRPVTWLETPRLWASPTVQANWGTVAITGLWGYSTRIPPVVWDAMLSASALNLFAGQFRGAGVPLGVKRWTGPDGISKEYDAAMLTSRLGQWQDDVEKAVMAYARWSLA